MSRHERNERVGHENTQVKRIPEFQAERIASAKILRPGHPFSLRNSREVSVARAGQRLE